MKTVTTNNIQDISMDKSEGVKNISFICPTCKIKKMISIPRNIVKKSEGLTSVSFRSGQVCEHTFQAFIDKNFHIRGYQRIDLEIDANSSLGKPSKLIKTEIQTEIENLLNTDNEIRGAILVRTNQNFSVAVLPESIDEKLIKAVSITFLGLSRKVSKSLFKSSFNNLTLDITSNILFISPICDFVLSIVTRRNPNMAMIEIEIEELKEKLIVLLKKLEKVNG